MAEKLSGAIFMDGEGRQLSRHSATSFDRMPPQIRGMISVMNELGHTVPVNAMQEDQLRKDVNTANETMDYVVEVFGQTYKAESQNGNGHGNGHCEAKIHSFRRIHPSKAK